MLPKWTIPKQRTQCIVQIVPSIPERLLVLHTVAITFLCPSGGKPDTNMHVQALVRWMRHRTAIIPTSYWKGPPSGTVVCLVTCVWISYLFWSLPMLALSLRDYCSSVTCVWISYLFWSLVILALSLRHYCSSVTYVWISYLFWSLVILALSLRD